MLERKNYVSSSRVSAIKETVEEVSAKKTHEGFQGQLDTACHVSRTSRRELLREKLERNKSCTVVIKEEGSTPSKDSSNSSSESSEVDQAIHMSRRGHYSHSKHHHQGVSRRDLLREKLQRKKSTETGRSVTKKFSEESNRCVAAEEEALQSWNELDDVLRRAKLASLTE